MPTTHIPSFRTRMKAWALIAFLAVACRRPAAVRIGDAIPRPARGHTIDDVVQGVFDSLPPGVRIRVERWGVGPGLEVAKAMEGANAFANMRDLVGVVGHGGSRDALLAATVYNAKGVPHVVPNATSRRLAAAGPWTFPLVPNDSVEGAFLGTYALDTLHAERIAVLYVGDEYGIGLRDGVRAALRSRQHDLVDATMLPNLACNTDLLEDIQRLPITAALRRAHPDAVVLATGVNTAACVIGIIRHEDPGTWILGGDGITTDFPGVTALTAAARSRVRSVVFWVPSEDPASVAFVDRFHRQLTGEPNGAQALWYDGMLLLATAVREGGASRSAVRRWLESLGHSRPPFPGVTGPISFDHGRVGARLRMMPPQEPKP